VAVSALEFHPLADIFPLVEGQDFAELVADIREHGLHEPIVVYEDRILDGRNRYRACTAAGVEPTFTAYTGDDPVAYVISLNLRRRHLDESQRAMVAAKLATLKDGQRADLVEGLPIGRASALLNVGERSVARAREVQEHGAPELIHAVEQGAISVTAAADIATQPIQEQREIVARGEREILKAASEIRARKAEIRHAERIAKLTEISNANSPIPSDRRYPIILADPPWRHEHPTFSLSRDIEQHYPTLSLEEICALPVGEIATETAMLFLWTPAPKLEEAFRVISAWGFEYRTGMVWVKHAIGLGNYVRQQHEHLLLARRGEIPLPEPANRPSSVIEAPRREHSRKPDEAYELIERMYPELPKIELFARQARPGWRCGAMRSHARRQIAGMSSLASWPKSRRGLDCEHRIHHIGLADLIPRRRG
jgi:N6-adenosine-specific RNA methylase IME4/ParB-like chromosome segregation protein Spo0J